MFEIIITDRLYWSKEAKEGEKIPENVGQFNKKMLFLIQLLRVENSKIIRLILHEASISCKVFSGEKLEDKLKEYERSGI